MANVLGRWFQAEIDCVGIGFEGWGYEQVPYQLIPGGRGDWNSPRKLTEFLQRLHEGDYTHAFILNDVDALSGPSRTGHHGFPQKLRQVCKAKGVRTMLYYPVDAPVEREWLGIVEAVDVAVAYTEYGRGETRKALQKSLYPIEVVPHGVDDCFKPLSVADRAKARIIELELASTSASQTTANFVEDDTFLIVNVNKNEWRKDPLRSLEIVKGLRELGVPAKLLLRMDAGSAMAGIDLDDAAQQLGLTYGKDYCHIGAVPDNAMVALYNAADLYLTTSLGEGWGLGVTEAMACHCPVAMPRHTSLAEIGEASGRVDADGADNGPIWLPSEEGFVGLGPMRLRRRVNLPGAVQAIYKAYGLRCGHGVRHAPADGHLKSWDWVAERLWGLLVGNK
jgi:glycosyltransferase involved in cell wall biosynthesis